MQHNKRRGQLRTVVLTCHVLAGVVSHALHNGIGARVAHTEALSCCAAEVCLSLHEALLISSGADPEVCAAECIAFIDVR